MSKPSVGAEIQSYCNSCKDVLTHVIVSMKGTRPARTECRTCGSVHAYRKNPPGVKSAGGRAESAKRSQFEKAMEGRDPAKAIKYKFAHRFKADDLVEHKKFGLGLVTRLLSETKMEVVFEDSTRVLIHNR